MDLGRGRPYDALASTEVPDTAHTPCEAFVGVEVRHEDTYGNRRVPPPTPT
jgi:hypothetical protein